MCSHLCTHFHVSNCKNEEYIRKQNRDARAHSFVQEGVIGQVKSPHGNPIKSVSMLTLSLFRKTSWSVELAMPHYRIQCRRKFPNSNVHKIYIHATSCFLDLSYLRRILSDKEEIITSEDDLLIL